MHVQKWTIKNNEKKRLDTRQMWLWRIISRMSSKIKEKKVVSSSRKLKKEKASLLLYRKTQRICHQHFGEESHGETTTKKTQTILLQRYPSPNEVHSIPTSKECGARYRVTRPSIWKLMMIQICKLVGGECCIKFLSP